MRASGRWAGSLVLFLIVSMPGGRAAAQSTEAPAPLRRIGFAEAVELAKTRSYTLAVARGDLERTEALLKQARAASLPLLTVNGTYTRLDADRTFGTGDMQRLVAGANQFNGNLTLSVPLLAPSRWAQWLHAADAVTVQKIAMEDVRRTVAVAAARAYLSVLSQRRVFEVAERAHVTARAHFDFANARFTGGLGNRLDVVRAEQEQRAAQVQLENSATALLRAREALGVVVAAGEPLDSDGEPLLATAPERETALTDALFSRSDIRALQARAWAAARLIRHRWVDFLPTVIGNFAPFYQDPPSITQPQLGWQASVQLSLPLFDGGLRYGQHAERWALYHQARANLDATRLLASSEVRSASAALAHLEAAEAAAKEGAAAADEALRLATLAYRTGTTSNLEVLDAERRARDAATQAVQAEDAVRQSRLDLLIASGHFP